MKPDLPLSSVRIKNFKAIRDSGLLKLDALTVFIGNNGSGKSSVIEALEAVKRLAAGGLDSAMGWFRDFEHVHHKGLKRPHRSAPGATRVESGPIGVALQGHHANRPFSATTEIGLREGNQIYLGSEAVRRSGFRTIRNEDEQQTTYVRGKESTVQSISRDVSTFREGLSDVLDDWQFVRLNPDAMGAPRSIKRSGARVRLEPDGSNVAEYLLELARDPNAFDGLFQALSFVLPYAKNFKVEMLSQIERQAYLQMAEADFNVPGWMLSTGTLRIAALLALFRHPVAPKVLFIEELENGLDPRTIGLIVDEIRSAVLSGRQQVVVTTHSPYLLDLFPLDSIVVVERVNGAPTFWRPNHDTEVLRWAKDFSPGALYTRGRFSAGDGQ